MKVYLAKDWRGCHVFTATEPISLKKCGGMPDIWTGHELKEFKTSGLLVEDEIPRGQYIERDIFWSIL